MKTIDVGADYYHRLANRDKQQGDGKWNAVQFRATFLQQLDSKEAWESTEPFITLDFINVKKIGPSFANEAFAYFTKYATPDLVLKKILFINASNVQMSIINTELNAGYTSWF